MSQEDNKDKQDAPAAERGKAIGRRDILQGLSTVPVLGLFGYAVKKQTEYQNARLETNTATTAPAGKLSDINVALLGGGDQGEVLLNSMLKIPGLRFRAVCDIWTEYNQKKLVNRLNRYNFGVKGYEDYREMLDKEKELDAVVIATPDFWHARHAIDCLRAGKHVYCEKEMSNTLEGAKSMVLAARETGKLLQIGHQRRSNPRYIHCHEKLLQEAKLLGRIVTAQGQWNRSVKPDTGWPQRYAIPDETLKKYGFKSMRQHRNWRWYKGLGGGPIVDLNDPYHKPHLENFFNAIRGTAELNCPAEVGYETAVTVLKVNEAIEANQRLAFHPEEFKI